jgi:hypothetical protein
MGIRYAFIPPLATSLENLTNRHEKKLLTLGVQDCNFTYSDLLAFLNRHHINHQTVDPAEVQTTTGYRISKQMNGAIHQKTLFQLLGFRPDNVFSLDYSDYERPDFVGDLSHPVSRDLMGRFDVVVDGGTVEHVASASEAFVNIIRMLKPGGLAIHLGNPLDMLAHGFYNFNPTLYRDFYSQNGFQELFYELICIPSLPSHRDDHCLYFTPEDYYCSLSTYYDCVHFAVFKKIEDRPPVLPYQGFYVSTWGKKEATATGTRKKWVGRLYDGLLSLAGTSMYTYSLLRLWETRRRGRKLIL